MNPTPINISYANLWSGMESFCHTHYKIRAQKSLRNLKWKLNQEKDALYPRDFFTALLHELRGCSNFFLYPSRTLTMSWFTTTMSTLKFQHGPPCRDLVSPPLFTFPLNLRGSAVWKNGGGSLKDLTGLWNISETSLNSPWGRQRRDSRTGLCYQLKGVWFRVVGQLWPLLKVFREV